LQTHPLVGAEILSSWGLDGPALFVRQHHENVDGSGYPDALAGEAIALESRIIRVADSFFAMTLDRPYRNAMSRSDAIEELERCAGTQFDQGVVDALIDLEGA